MKSKNNLIPIEIIRAATNGDTEAIQFILNHYSAYIAKLSQRPFTDDNGNTHLYIDEQIRQQLETKLIAKILMFDAA